MRLKKVWVGNSRVNSRVLRILLFVLFSQIPRTLTYSVWSKESKTREIFCGKADFLIPQKGFWTFRVVVEAVVVAYIADWFLRPLEPLLLSEESSYHKHVFNRRIHSRAKVGSSVQWTESMFTIITFRWKLSTFRWKLSTSSGDKI